MNYARALRQHLELYRAAGWDPPLRRPQPPTPLTAKLERPAGSSAPAAVAAVSTAERLTPLREEVAACTRCGLCQSRTNTVFGVGNPDARLMFVGEGPGHEEDRQGEPFVGRAGQLLDKIITAMHLQRENVYIGNIVKCRPPQNRNPAPDEVGACRPYLDQQIEIVAPEVIVALGSVAARVLLGVDQPIGRLRARFHDFRGIAVMPTYHPAYLLRTPSDKRKVWEDMQQVMVRLGL